MKKSNILLSLLLALTVSLLCACGGEETAAPAGGEAAETPAVEENTAPAPEVNFEGPALLVAVGESADISIAKSVMTKTGIEFGEYADGVNVADYKSAILIPGVSVKGLGAAGIAVDEELAATETLLGELDAAGVQIIVAHLGGSSRRDELTDQFIDAVLPAADYICALEEGNQDGKFSDYAEANSVPYSMEASLVSIVSTFGALYGTAQ